MFVSEYNDIKIGKKKNKQGRDSNDTNECHVWQSMITAKAVKGNTGVF